MATSWLGCIANPTEKHVSMCMVAPAARAAAVDRTPLADYRGALLFGFQLHENELFHFFLSLSKRKGNFINQ